MKEELIKPIYKLEEVSELIPKILDQSGLKTRLKNAVFNLHNEAVLSNKSFSVAHFAPFPAYNPSNPPISGPATASSGSGAGSNSNSNNNNNNNNNNSTSFPVPSNIRLTIDRTLAALLDISAEEEMRLRKQVFLSTASTNMAAAPSSSPTKNLQRARSSSIPPNSHSPPAPSSPASPQQHQQQINLPRLSKKEQKELAQVIFSREEKLDVVENARKTWSTLVKDSLRKAAENFKVPLLNVTGPSMVSCTRKEKNRARDHAFDLKHRRKTKRNETKQIKTKHMQFLKEGSKRSRSKINRSKKNGMADDPLTLIGEDDGAASATAEEEKQCRPRVPVEQVVTSDLLLLHISKINNPNHSGTFSRVIGWGLIKLELKTIEFKELKLMFKELNPEIRQTGLDEEHKCGIFFHLQAFLQFY